jgi:hypothetical protein
MRIHGRSGNAMIAFTAATAPTHNTIIDTPPDRVKMMLAVV